MANRIGFGGGCHWCTESVFLALRGVSSVEQGYIAARTPDDDFSEAVAVTFDPKVIPLKALIEIHLRTHASTSAHKMRGKYRSAIYATSPAQAQDVQDALGRLQTGFHAAIVTRVLEFATFKPSDSRYHDYYAQNEDGPFCTRYIDPKLDTLRADFSRYLKEAPPPASDTHTASRD